MNPIFKGVCVTLLITAAASAYAEPPFAKGRLLVEPANGISETRFNQMLNQLGAKSIKVIPQIDLHLVQLPAQADEHAMAALLNHNPLVKFAELDSQLPAEQTANDTYYSLAWQLPKIQAPTAWDSSKGAGITVAIVDTGVYAAHPDLTGKVLSGWNVVSNNSDTSDITGHGTGVAGTVAAASNNSTGVTSVAWDAMLLPVRVSNSSDGSAYLSDLANGVVWAADHGARVANVSYGVSGSASVQSAANYMRGKDGVVVVSAGNSGAYDSTAPSDALLSVGATDSSDAIASFSTSGSFVDLSAPGVNIPSTSASGGYSYWSGTSFSSPVVAGVAALVLAANPALSPAQVDSILTSSSDDLGSPGYDIYFGAGRVNAARAVALAMNTQAIDSIAPSVTINNPVTGSTVSGTVAIGVNASDNVGVTRVDIYANGKLLSSSTSANFSYAWDTSLAANGSTTLVAYAMDAAGNQGQSQSVSVDVANLVSDTQPPTVAFTSPSDGTTVNGKTTIRVSASDNVAVTTLALAIDGRVVSSTSGGSLNYNWNTRKVAAGSHTLTTTASDAAGNSSSSSITVNK